MRVKKLIRNLVSSMVFLLGLSALMGTYIFRSSSQLVTNKETKGPDLGFLKDQGLDFEGFLASYEIEYFGLLSSFEGHRIPGDYIYSPLSKESKDWPSVILVHGLGGNRFSNYPLAEYFLELGYNVLSYDQRSSGDNLARFTSFGYFEKYDLLDLVDYLKELAPNKELGIWAASYGGATGALALAYGDTQERVDFFIMDSPITSMDWMIKDQLAQKKLGFLAPYLSWWSNKINKFRLGFSYEEVEVARALEGLSLPTLLINSRGDKVTPYYLAKAVYEANKKGAVHLWTVEDSGHFEIWRDHKEEYKERIKELINRAG